LLGVQTRFRCVAEVKSSPAHWRVLSDSELDVSKHVTAITVANDAELHKIVLEANTSPLDPVRSPAFWRRLSLLD
jgi:hypothetical protein